MRNHAMIIAVPPTVGANAFKGELHSLVSCRLVDARSVFQHPFCGFLGVAYTGQLRSCFDTNRGFRTFTVCASKKGGQSLKTTDPDNEDLVAEADLQYKPLGFGHGKVYDTSLEEKLLEEIEQEKTAKGAGLDKRKTNDRSTNNSKIKSTSKPPETVDGVKVWVGDLPKKKNVHRDLQSAFRIVPGIVDISPSVQGNEKTRDPICKGFGFLTFDTLDHAISFISSFKGRPISFGKVEKKLTLKLVKANNAEVVASEKKSSSEVGRLRIRDKDARKVVESHSNTELATLGQKVSADAMQDREIPELAALGQNVSANAMQELGHTEKYPPQVEVIEDGEVVGLLRLSGESSSEDEDSGDEFDSDDDAEFEISIETEELPGDNAPRAEAKGDETTDTMDAEKQIEELERRLRKKLEDAGYGAQKSKREVKPVKGKGFTAKRIGASKQLLPKKNNVAAVTHGLKKTERAFMTGVLEKYGQVPSTTKS